MALWIVAYNRTTKSWLSGGTASDYNRAHDDLYQVDAGTREAAESEARGRRAHQVRITPPQATLLASLIECARDDMKSGVSLTAWMELDGPEVGGTEVRVAKGLAAKGLVTLYDESQARLTFDALNHAPRELAEFADMLSTGVDVGKDDACLTLPCKRM